MKWVIKDVATGKYVSELYPLRWSGTHAVLFPAHAGEPIVARLRKKGRDMVQLVLVGSNALMASIDQAQKILAAALDDDQSRDLIQLCHDMVLELDAEHERAMQAEKRVKTLDAAIKQGMVYKEQRDGE